MDLSKLTIPKLIRQLRVFGCVVDEEDKKKFTKKELINAINFATKDRVVKEVKIDDEILQGLTELYTDFKFSVGETVLVLVPEDEVKKPDAPAKKQLFYGGSRQPVRKIEDVVMHNRPHKKIYLLDGSTTVCAAEDLDKLIFSNLA